MLSSWLVGTEPSLVSQQSEGHHHAKTMPIYSVYLLTGKKQEYVPLVGWNPSSFALNLPRMRVQHLPKTHGGALHSDSWDPSLLEQRCY